MFGKKNKATEPQELSQNYWAYVSRQFKKNKRALYSLYFTGFLALIALFADFIANEKPIICKYEGSVYMPVLKGYAVNLGLAKWPEAFNTGDWKSKEYDFVLWPPIPYLPNNLDYKASWASPFGAQEVKSTQWRHWLGTDDLGRDVMAGMIHGTRIAFMVGIIAMGIACIIGIFLGACAGYFGDSGLELTRGGLIFNIIALILAFFYGFYSRTYVMSDAFSASFGSGLWSILLGILIFLGIMVLANIISIAFRKIPFFNKRVAFPVDIAITRVIEVVRSIPLLVLILAIVAVAKPSIFLVMAVIGTVSWTGIARFIRGELLRVRQLEYIEAANALGFSQMRTMFKHAIPNSLSPVFIAVAFGIAAAILTESFLSFLGLGVPAETITWGKMLAISRTNPSAWWFAIFPGFAIFITVTLFNLIGEGLTDALDPRLKQ